MPQQIQSNNVISWTFDNYTALAGLLSGIAIICLVFYIYYRSGSLMLLRDLMWRFLGGSTKFDDTTYETSRKTLREVEHYRFEFNIPAQTLADATLAEKWIKNNSFSHRDIARVKRYIEWTDFSNLTFKTKLFSKKAENIFAAILLLTMLFIAIAPSLASTNYLMVSLTNSPKTPSFFISESNAKFTLLSNNLLTPAECNSSTLLQKFVNPEISENDLDIICSFFIEPGYAKHVRDGLSEQRSLFLVITLISTFTTFCLLTKLTRIRIARKLHTQLQTA